MLYAAAVVLCLNVSAGERARDVGVVIGPYAPGPRDAITDVKGVRVGHATVKKGDGKLVPGKGPARTGVTAILAHGGDLWHEKVPAAAFVMNGNGEVTGLHWVNEQGALEVPILLTNTMNVPRVADGALSWLLKRNAEIGVTDDVILPVVGECDDSDLNDARGRHVSEADVFAALDAALASGDGAAVVEGAVGGGTGMIAYGFKGGIGTSSRVIPAASDDPGFGPYVVGALVNANMGPREQLTLGGVNVGRGVFATSPPEPGAPPPTSTPAKPEGHSIVVVIATDAPVDARQLARIAKRGAIGITRTGSDVHHGSGDFIIAFSTASRVPHAPKSPTRTVTVLSDDRIDPLFDAAADAVEEAITNALLAATTTTGRDGITAYALPHDKLKAALAKRP